jgi:hypothetical protein
MKISAGFELYPVKRLIRDGRHVCHRNGTAKCFSLTVDACKDCSGVFMHPEIPGTAKTTVFVEMWIHNSAKTTVFMDPG